MTRKQRELIDHARQALEAVEGFKEYLTRELERKRADTEQKPTKLIEELHIALKESTARGTLPLSMMRLHRCDQLMFGVIQASAEYIEVYNQARLLGILKHLEEA